MRTPAEPNRVKGAHLKKIIEYCISSNTYKNNTVIKEAFFEIKTSYKGQFFLVHSVFLESFIFAH